MQRFIVFLIFTILATYSHSQVSILDNYIKAGLENNLALKQKQLSYDKSHAALKEAKGLFFPDFSFNSRFTVADGGRVIDFPIGDMLNPIHQGLNQILTSQGYPASYPTDVENESFTFYRVREHETKLSIIQPIFSPEIYYNHQIKKELIRSGGINVNIYKRLLVAEIKKAYYNYLKTLQLLKLFDTIHKLLQENLRVSESLFRNNVRTVDVVYRSKAELSKFDQQRSEAVKQNQQASAYFNFLLNKPLDSEIQIVEDVKIILPDIEINSALNIATQNREELEQMKSFLNVTDKFIKLNKSSYYPTLFGAVDYGFQGSEFRFTNEDDYILASLVMRWNLFQGFQNKAKVQQAFIDKQTLDTKLNEVEKLINLEVINAYYDLLAVQKSIVAAKDQKVSAKKAFDIVNKKYKEGQANLIQFIDARTTMTNAEQNLIITKFDFQIAQAEYERVTGAFPLSKVNAEKNKL